jgi:hypothetical protein
MDAVKIRSLVGLQRRLLVGLLGRTVHFHAISTLDGVELSCEPLGVTSASPELASSVAVACGLTRI